MSVANNTMLSEANVISGNMKLKFPSSLTVMPPKLIELALLLYISRNSKALESSEGALYIISVMINPVVKAL